MPVLGWNCQSGAAPGAPARTCDKTGFNAMLLGKGFWVYWTPKSRFWLPPVGEHLISKDGMALGMVLQAIERFLGTSAVRSSQQVVVGVVPTFTVARRTNADIEQSLAHAAFSKFNECTSALSLRWKLIAHAEAGPARPR